MESKKQYSGETKKIKSSISLQLGTYEAIRIPIYNTILSMFIQVATSYSWPQDPRIANYPFIGNRITWLAVSCLYILFSLTWGPKWMENRQPIKPKKMMMAYNLIQVVFCSYIFVESCLGGWLTDYNWRCQPVETSSTPKTMRMVNVVYMYYLSKILDFTDTVFLVLGKRWSSLSMLHVIHHSVMFIGAWQGLYFTPSGHYTFIAFINSAVHVVMYGYYFLAACGDKVQPYLWWKKYLTTAQIIQFVIIFFHTTQILVRDCPVSKVYAWYICIFAMFFVALFTDFYVHEYKKNPLLKDSVSMQAFKSKSTGEINLAKWLGSHCFGRPV